MPEINNVVIILDASGSMGDIMHNTSIKKIDAAKSALWEVLRHVPEQTHIGLLVFSARNVPNDWVYPLGERDDAALTAAIDLPQPGGKTPLGRYIKKGADRLLRARAEQLGRGTYRLLIVTDGEAGDKDLVERYVPEVLARGIAIDVIGVDMKQTHTLARKVTSYRSADDPQSLNRAVKEVFAEVGMAGTDTTDAAAFEEIAALPDGVAAAMIQAVTTVDNDPIGKNASQSRVKANRKAARKQRRSPRNRRSTSSPFHKMSLILIVIAVLLVVKKMFRR